MTISTFLMLLTAFSIITSLFTEGIKKLLDSLKISYASNIVVLISALLVGGIGMNTFYMFTGIEFTTNNCFCILLMALANWLVAMVGYDKVKQAILQLKGGGKDE